MPQRRGPLRFRCLESASPNIVAVDLFCGASGLSLGLKEAGITIAAGVDLDPACAFPFEENVQAPFYLQDVSVLTAEDISDMFAGAPVRLLAGCAPCQPFSGYTTKRREVDRRWNLLLEFLRVALAIRPEIITLENVPRLTHLSLWNEFVQALDTAGYHVSWRILNAADYGVPQVRKRVVLLASLYGPIAMPQPLGAMVTVREIIGSLPPVQAGARNDPDALHRSRVLTEANLERIRASRQAGTWREWPAELRVNCHNSERGRTYPSVYGRMSWDKPAPTITTQFYGFGNGRFGHPEQDRAITLREGALLQSFPKDFVFDKPGRKVSFRAIGRLIGNAVPPKLGRAIGDAICSHVADVFDIAGQPLCAPTALVN